MMKNNKIDLLNFVWIWNEKQGLKTPRHHRKICRFLSEQWKNKQNTLLMAFRNSGKSTLVGLFCAWVLYENPNTRILILSADFELAKKMVRNIKRIIEKHPLTYLMKPEQKDQWASDRFTVVRPIEARDSSVLARGLGGNITGSRADLIVCDDVEVPKTCETHNKREDLRNKLSELDFVLAPDGMQLYVGTPHTFDTIYNISEDGFLQDFKRLKLPIVNNKGQSAWPERFPEDKISAIRKRAGPARFLSQMLLEPTSLNAGRLDVNKLRFYDEDLTYRSANLSSVLKIGDEKMVSASCWWDPAFGKTQKSDGSVIACIFCDAKGNYYLHDVAYLKVEDSQQSAHLQCEQVADFVEKYHLPSVMVETNGIGKFLPEVLRQVLHKRKIRCAVLEKVSSRQKENRIIDAFDAVLADGALWVRSSIKKSPFMEEMKEWVPFSGAHDDGLDAVAGCLLNEPVRLPRTGQGASYNVKTDWRFNLSD